MTAREAIMLRINEGRAFSVDDFQGHAVTTCRAIVQQLRKQGLCHIHKWIRVGPKGMPKMVLIGGPGEDATIPPVDQEKKRLKRNAQSRKYYRYNKQRNPTAGSQHRKTKYGLRSYKIDPVLTAMEEGRVFDVCQAALYAGTSYAHMGQLLKRARDAKLICIYEWDTSKGGGAIVYGWRHIDMEDAPRPGKGALDKKRKELKQTARQWGWFYGQPAAV